MERAVEIISTLKNFIETELSAIERKTWRILITISVLLLAGILFIAGFAMIIWAVYLGLNELMTPYLAALATGLLAFVMGGALVLWAKRRVSNTEE
jgi:protein-S-isoprenylcysteine O-methyltransferase Ste14